jgi:hypothetical protein
VVNVHFFSTYRAWLQHEHAGGEVVTESDEATEARVLAVQQEALASCPYRCVQEVRSPIVVSFSPVTE